MFKNILIPVSSEFYRKEILERSAFLAEKFKSRINIIYIIEEKTLKQTDKLTDAYRTHYDINKTKKDIIREQRLTANGIIFDDAKLFFKNKDIPFEEKIAEGEFSEIIKNEINKKNFDLIMMGFEKECTLNYRLFDEVKIPIWIVSKDKKNSILAVCSNLAPNQKVPEISTKLSKLLNWDLHMLYIVDTQDTVEIDENGRRTAKKPQKNLIYKGEKFLEEMKKKGIKTNLVKGSLEKETIKAADKLAPTLVVIGREQKKKSILGLPVKSVKRKMAEKCKYSILFIN